MNLAIILIATVLLVGCSNSGEIELVDEYWSCRNNSCDVNFKVFNNSDKRTSVKIKIQGVIVGRRLSSLRSVIDERETIDLEGIDYVSFQKSYTVTKEPTFIRVSVSN